MDCISIEKIRHLNSENGSILILALMLLVLLSLLGISGTTTSTIEVQIAGNDRNYKRNFYKAEAGAMEGAQRIENEDNKSTLLNHTPVWLHTGNVMTDVSNWDYDDAGGNDNAETADSLIDSNSTTYYTVVDLGVPPGGSLTMGGSSLHEYAIYGLYDSTDGQSMVEVGYRKRF